MRTSQTLQTLKTERNALYAQIETLEDAIKALESFQKLNAPNVGSNGRKPEKAQQVENKRKQVQKQCPDCGQMFANGAGLASHRRLTHGWEKGMPLDQPVRQPVEMETSQV
jgi:uncharacterized C2H2 Zn-finger protein